MHIHNLCTLRHLYSIHKLMHIPHFTINLSIVLLYCFPHILDSEGQMGSNTFTQGVVGRNPEFGLQELWLRNLCY